VWQATPTKAAVSSAEYINVHTKTYISTLPQRKSKLRHVCRHHRARITMFLGYYLPIGPRNNQRYFSGQWIRQGSNSNVRSFLSFSFRAQTWNRHTYFAPVSLPIPFLTIQWLRYQPARRLLDALSSLRSTIWSLPPSICSSAVRITAQWTIMKLDTEKIRRYIQILTEIGRK
jgi:hypothetical protein